MTVMQEKLRGAQLPSSPRLQLLGNGNSAMPYVLLYPNDARLPAWPQPIHCLQCEAGCQYSFCQGISAVIPDSKRAGSAELFLFKKKKWEDLCTPAVRTVGSTWSQARQGAQLHLWVWFQKSHFLWSLQENLAGHLVSSRKKNKTSISGTMFALLGKRTA